MAIRTGRRTLSMLGALIAMAGAAFAAASGTAESATPGPAAVYSGWKNNFSTGKTAPGQQKQIARLFLPAGSYTVFAKLNLEPPVTEGYPAIVKCYLRAGDDNDYAVATQDPVLASVPMSLNVVHTFTAGGQVVLSCGSLGSSATTELSMIKITAIRASSLSNKLLP
ncbi:hypothetical protein ACIBK1_12745 [Microbispora rosea]|uniref:hypothetical protein n=1 Tax=Microbispora rosea TaxID=58117 RepID=UPI0012DFD2DE|nr:hypothetical protein [Microbispora rosea]